MPSKPARQIAQAIVHALRDALSDGTAKLLSEHAATESRSRTCRGCGRQGVLNGVVQYLCQLSVP